MNSIKTKFLILQVEWLEVLLSQGIRSVNLTPFIIFTTICCYKNFDNFDQYFNINKSQRNYIRYYHWVNLISLDVLLIQVLTEKNVRLLKRKYIIISSIVLILLKYWSLTRRSNLFEWIFKVRKGDFLIKWN